MTMKNAIERHIPWILLLTMAILLLVPATAAFGQKQRTMKYSTRSAKKAEIWQSEVKAKLATVLKIDDLMKSGRDIPLSQTEIRVENKGSYLLKEIEINSTANRRIRILLTCPLLTTGPWPAVVCLHGHDGQAGSVYEMEAPYNGFGYELARRNYVTIAPVISQHEVYEEGRTLIGERLWDAMRCVDFLGSCFSVDTSRIGCAGHSLGGEMAMWLAAMDPRVKATVSSGFLTRMDQLELGHCLCWKTPGLRELVDFSDIYSLIAPRPLLCQNGLKEPPGGFTVEIARQAMKDIEIIYMNYSRPENVTLIAHPEGHVVDIQSLLSFFKMHLKPIKTNFD
jgi:hypothetical protein